MDGRGGSRRALSGAPVSESAKHGAIIGRNGRPVCQRRPITRKDGPSLSDRYPAYANAAKRRPGPTRVGAGGRYRSPRPSPIVGPSCPDRSPYRSACNGHRTHGPNVLTSLSTKRNDNMFHRNDSAHRPVDGRLVATPAQRRAPSRRSTLPARSPSAISVSQVTSIVV